MAKELQANQYQAKIIDYGIGEAKTGTPQVMVLLEILDIDNDRHEATWYGFLTENAMPHTLKTLLQLGFRGNDIETLAEGVLGNTLNVDNPVLATIEREAKQGDPTKTFAKVKWLNPMGGSAFRAKLSRQEAKQKLGALNVKGALLALRQETGIKDAPPPAAQKQAVGQSFSNFDEELGF